MKFTIEPLFYGVCLRKMNVRVSIGKKNALKKTSTSYWKKWRRRSQTKKDIFLFQHYLFCRILKRELDFTCSRMEIKFEKSNTFLFYDKHVHIFSSCTKSHEEMTYSLHSQCSAPALPEIQV